MRFLLLLSLLCAVALAHGQRFGQPVRSPEVGPDRKVTFRFRAPNAAKVEVVMEGLARLAMVKDEKGNWSVTTEPLEADLYNYVFAVDGVAVADPANDLRKPMVTGGNESIVCVPGSPPAVWELAEVPHGLVHRHTYVSKVVGETRDFWVYTPPGYDARERKTYPTLYLLHGVMEDSRAWLETGRTNLILDNLIAQGKAKPMVIVMPPGYGFPNAADNVAKQFGGAADQRKFMEAMSKTVLDEVVPEVEKTYRVGKDRNDRAIAGLSLGGAQALFIGLNHLDRFASVGSFGAAVITYWDKYDNLFPTLNAQSNSQLKLLMVACAKQDFLSAINKKYREFLDGKGVKYTSVEIPGGHTWMVWRRNLIELAPMLFKS